MRKDTGAQSGRPRRRRTQMQLSDHSDGSQAISPFFELAGAAEGGSSLLDKAELLVLTVYSTLGDANYLNGHGARRGQGQERISGVGRCPGHVLSSPLR